MTYGAERCTNVTWAACLAISGTNWMALAPVPRTTTRRPVRSHSWSHRAEWNAVPAKSSSPGTSGYAGRLSWPQAAITTSCMAVVPSAKVSVHWEPFHDASVTSCPNRTSGVTPKSSATRLR